MKRTFFAFILAGSILLTGCSTLNGLLGGSSASKDAGTETTKSSDTSVLTDILSGVFGSRTFTQKDMVGTWNYESTACAFETENLLKKAGGAVVATQVENEFDKYCTKVGINQTSTSFTFNADSTYSAKLGKVKLSGKYHLDPATKKVTLTYMFGVGKINGFASKSGSDLKLLFDADSMLKLMKILSQFTDNTSIEVLGKMADMYDGMLLGFDLKKTL